MSQTDVDVAIVGAGPAGAAAALALVGRELRIALIEKAVPPRYKTCGGGLLNRAVHLLPVDIAPAVERRCFDAQLVHHDPDLQFAVRREQPIISMVMRDRFDQLLTDAARRGGAELLAGRTVLAVEPRADGVELTTDAGTVTSRFVIAADGASSAVARLTSAAALPKVAPALECEVTPQPGEMERFGYVARFDFGLIPHGYAWVFPKREHLSIGVLTTRRGAANLNEHYENYLSTLGIHHPRREERHGFMIPIRPRPNALNIPRVLFVGDAAGLADPLLAEGITAAIRSGQLAAEAIVRGGFDESATKSAYRRMLASELLPEWRVARFLARWLYDFPKVRSALMRRHGGGLCELVTHIVMGATTYAAAVRRPSHYLKLFNRASAATDVC